MIIAITYPLQVNLYTRSTQTGQGVDEVLEWCEQSIPGRYYQVLGGDHDYECPAMEAALECWEDSCVDPIVFRDKDAMMLFKLRWGGQQKDEPPVVVCADPLPLPDAHYLRETVELLETAFDAILKRIDAGNVGTLRNDLREIVKTRRNPPQVPSWGGKQ